MEVLKNVLIKEANGGKMGDLVVFVDNLPKSLLYRKAAKLMIDYTNPQQNLVPEFVMDVRGNKIPTGAQTDELLPGIEMSQTGDNAYVFVTHYNEAKDRLKAIDNYMRQVMPIAERIQERIPYAIQPGVMTSGPKPLSDIPRVVLPEPVSPPASAAQVAAAPSAVLSEESATKAAKASARTDAEKEAAREKMRKVRLAKTVKNA